VPNIESKSRQFLFQIWKIHYTSNHLLLELRDPELRVLKLVYLSLDGLEILAETQNELLSWWDNVIHVFGSYIALGTYKNPKLPATQGIKVLDIHTGNFLWQQDKWRIVEGRDENLLIVKDATNPLRVDHISIISGNVFEQKANNLDGSSKLYLPEFYTEGEVFFEQVSGFLKSKNYTPVKSIEYLDFESLIVIGIYNSLGDLEKQEKDAMLLIFDNLGRLISSYKCDDSVKEVGMGLFFVVKDQLVFVRDKKEIVILELSHCIKR
jgi:hypothetical protein